MKSVKDRSGGKPLFYLATSALFLFFLAYSTPHQVHHFFDPYPGSACVAFALSKGCHLKPTPAIDLPIIQTKTARISQTVEVRISNLAPSPFSQRAPPLV